MECKVGMLYCSFRNDCNPGHGWAAQTSAASLINAPILSNVLEIALNFKKPWAGYQHQWETSCFGMETVVATKYPIIFAVDCKPTAVPFKIIEVKPPIIGDYDTTKCLISVNEAFEKYFMLKRFINSAPHRLCMYVFYDRLRNKRLLLQIVSPVHSDVFLIKSQSRENSRRILQVHTRFCE